MRSMIPWCLSRIKLAQEGSLFIRFRIKVAFVCGTIALCASLGLFVYQSKRFESDLLVLKSLASSDAVVVSVRAEGDFIFVVGDELFDFVNAVKDIEYDRRGGKIAMRSLGDFRVSPSGIVVKMQEFSTDGKYIYGYIGREIGGFFTSHGGIRSEIIKGSKWFLAYF